MDQGIIQAYKMKYRRLVEDKLLSLNTDSIMPDLDILYAANKTGESWRNISSIIIKYCFKYSGFYKCKGKNINEIDKEKRTHNDENEENNDVNEEEDDVIKKKRQLDKLVDKINLIFTYTLVLMIN
jgi:hypothetical protein